MPSTTDRALSTPLKILLYGLLGVVSLVVVLTVVSIVFELLWSLVGLLFSIVALAVTVGVLAAIGYAVYWLTSRVLGQDETTASATQTRSTDRAGTTGTDGADPVDRLTERYARGEITEAELERRLEQTLDDPSADDDAASFERDRELN
ncbi:SHOCT domain-containing protein [Haloarcula salina]|uniref:SHOCT domain-containing protein n=1 Tax=Haloarcula salina TaxID=1429914 RepID=UPI003C700956